MWRTICFHLITFGVDAWWDQGHMLVAAVAEQLLMGAPNHLSDVLPWTLAEGNRALTTTSKVLHAWESDYPDFSGLIGSAVWADHIKCVQSTPFCNSLTKPVRFDAIEIFNHYHFVDITYPQAAAAVAQEMEAAKMHPGNSMWLLKQVTESLSVVLRLLRDGSTSLGGLFEMSRQLRIVKDPVGLLIHLLQSNHSYEYTQQRSQFLSQRARLSLPTLDSPEGEWRQFGRDVLGSKGTKFSLNLMLRLLIHVMGDLHQPLHTITYKSSTCYPHGDRGGNAIPVKLTHVTAADEEVLKSRFPQAGGSMNLHALWDSGGLTLAQNFPSYTIEQARNQARTFLSDYQIDESKFNSNAFDTIRMANLSYQFAPLIYAEIVNETQCFTRARPYAPSAEYLSFVKKVSQQQITLAGINLAYHLQLISNEISDALLQEMEPAGISQSTFWRNWAVASTSATIALVVIGARLLLKVGRHETKSFKRISTRILTTPLVAQFPSESDVSDKGTVPSRLSDGKIAGSLDDTVSSSYEEYFFTN